MHLIIADHTLNDYMGHSFEYCQSVRNAALQKGWKATVLGTKRVSPELQREIEAQPFFEHDFFHTFPLPLFARVLPGSLKNRFLSQWNFRGHRKSMLRSLAQIQQECSRPEPTLVLFPTFSFNDIVPIVQFAQNLPAESKTKIAMVQHFTTQPGIFQPWKSHYFYRLGFSLLNRSPTKNRILLFADCEELIEEYSRYTTHPMELLPIPHAANSSTALPPSDENRPLTLGYLGDARLHKGFHFLPEAILEVQKKWQGRPISWELQANVRNESEWEIPQAVRLLEKIPGVRLHKQAMPTRDYRELMGRIDIILLPYLTTKYHSATSGIYSEIRSLGKVAVASRGTWTARKIKEDGGGVLCLPEDPKSLADAILQALQNFDALSSQAVNAVGQWAVFHNPANYLERLNQAFLEGN